MSSGLSFSALVAKLACPSFLTWISIGVAGTLETGMSTEIAYISDAFDCCFKQQALLYHCKSAPNTPALLLEPVESHCGSFIKAGLALTLRCTERQDGRSSRP